MSTSASGVSSVAAAVCKKVQSAAPQVERFNSDIYCFTFFFMKTLSVPGTGWSAPRLSMLGASDAEAFRFCRTKLPNRLALGTGACALEEARPGTRAAFQESAAGATQRS
jgi:hypothetical protein